MIQIYIERLGWFVGLVLLQVLVLNHIHIAGYATPFFYVYFILKLPSGMSRNALMLWAFFIGLTIDMFSDTPGMNAATCVFLAAVRPGILQAFIPRDTFEDVVPSCKSIGLGVFMKYAIVAVLLHHTVLLFIESFSLIGLPILLLKIVTSSILSLIFIMAVEGVKK